MVLRPSRKKTPPRLTIQIKDRLYQSYIFFWWRLGNKRKSKSSSHKRRLIKKAIIF